ncbi:type II toxin-antitoxin system CcdA family antitoxin [Ramlibacter sp. Leaf400]|uniref:type II toxin-antitoxin system CcdA family antitoxin n=1 Tax=Ramlibacter sp. Leaf400 TaxID=1736365 RepID=UPI0006F91270|nr:type II toxin-antitoxin system CcdA family antitoxin [Ramlibacter sp. Leaf400]KQT13612.1 post-segregation antitoxin CcdA [Ramlibacter sp. Leaf400]
MPKIDDVSKICSLHSKIQEMARSLGMNMPPASDEQFATDVSRRYWERWHEVNHEAIAEYNSRIAAEGLPLAKYRTY